MFLWLFSFFFTLCLVRDYFHISFSSLDMVSFTSLTILVTDPKFDIINPIFWLHWGQFLCIVCFWGIFWWWLLFLSFLSSPTPMCTICHTFFACLIDYSQKLDIKDNIIWQTSKYVFISSRCVTVLAVCLVNFLD